jgi:DNA-binding MarR family transcriptional regulator
MIWPQCSLAQHAAMLDGNYSFEIIDAIAENMPWKEFEANELTHSAAHHLLAIHDVGAPYGGWARVSDIARKLNITRGSVSINLRTLKKRGWIETDAHRLVKLSPAGLRAVQAVMAKRVVFKTFLVDVLGVSAPRGARGRGPRRARRCRPGCTGPGPPGPRPAADLGSRCRQPAETLQALAPPRMSEEPFV